MICVSDMKEIGDLKIIYLKPNGNIKIEYKDNGCLLMGWWYNLDRSWHWAVKIYRISDDIFNIEGIDEI